MSSRPPKRKHGQVYTDQPDDDSLSTEPEDCRNAVRRPSDCCYHWRPEEDYYLNGLVANLGTRWVLIAAELPGRTESMARNRFFRIHRRAPDGYNTAKQKPKEKAEAWLERQPEGAWMQTFLYFITDL